MSQQYYRTVFGRVLKETWHWGKEQVLIILLAIATLALQIREGLVRSGDWKPSIIAMVSPYIAYAAIFLLYQFMRSQQLLYGELDASLRAVTAERDTALRSLTEKPQRTNAEQHDYDKLVNVLEMTKETGLIALRHIRSVGTMTFGGPYSPTLPPGLTPERALWVYRHCAAESLLAYSSSLGMTQEIFSVLPKMDKTFDEVLFR